jgi:uncharacterized protein (DUF2336 family)
MGFLARLLRRGRGGETQKRDPVRYEQEKDAARNGDTKTRLALAGDPRTHQEILYYLATHDQNARVRQAVARNASTPLQAGTILALDPDVDVRMALAGRLLALLPDLDPGRQSQLYAFAVQALAALALDQVLIIRKALSSALRDYADAPPKIAGQLARDIEREVSEPILRFCVALADSDLLDILKQHPESWAVQAIAGRPKVNPKISQAVIASDDRAAGLVLLNNKGAVITQDLMAAVIEKSRHYTEWQKPLAVHASLPPAMGRKLSQFADIAVQELLLQRGDLDEEMRTEIATVFHRRMAYAGDLEKGAKETPAARAARVEKEGKLNEDTLSDALAMRDRAFVVAALARMAHMDVTAIEKVLNLKAAKPIVAVSRRAGLSMRMALQLQKEMGQVPPKELLYPRGGTDYPMDDEELAKQLEFLGLKKAQ